jgi:hypothetical protein
MISRLSAVVILSLAAPAQAFSSTLFPQAPTAQQTFPSKTGGVEIELPDFDDLFSRIQQVSPLARVAIEGGEINGKRGFAAVDNTCELSIRIAVVFCKITGD